MTVPDTDPGAGPVRFPERFATTRWSVVVSAGEDWSPLAQQALERLCRTYWGPLCAYVRQRGFAEEEAEDLTQQFFLRFLEKRLYRLADRDRGRFRSFLLTSLKNFLVNESRRAAAQKRGGGLTQVSLDLETEEGGERQFEPSDNQTAEWLFERSWALTVLEQVRTKLAAEYNAEGKAERFAVLEPFLSGEPDDLSYAGAAAKLGVALGTIKSHVHRLKQRYRDLLREEVSQTVATPAEVDQEIRELARALGRPQAAQP